MMIKGKFQGIISSLVTILEYKVKNYNKKKKTWKIV